MRLRLIGSILLSYFILTAVAHAALPTPVVKIDADQLPTGKLTTMPNMGSAGGNFLSICNPAPIVERVAGRMAITFTGKNGLQSDFLTPLTLLDQHAWSFATWIYNPTLNGEERYVAWAWKPNNYSGAGEGGTNRQTVFGYGYAYAWGAIALNGGGGDQSWGRMPVPKAGVWHHIAVTFSGTPGTMMLYVDGKPVSAETDKWLALGYFTSAPAGVTPSTGIYQAKVRIGTGYRSITGVDFNAIAATPGTYSFSGSIASMYMYDVELTPSDILALAGGSAPTGPYLFDPSFEFNNHGNDATVPPFELDGSPTGGSTGWTVGGDTGYCGAWNTGVVNGNGVDTGSPGTGINVYRYTAAGRIGNPTWQWNKYNSTATRSTMVDGLAAISQEAGDHVFSSAAPQGVYEAFPGLNGKTDSTEWTQPIWGIKPGHNYKAWGFFSPTSGGTGSFVGLYTHATIKLDDTYAFKQANVYVKKANDPFQYVSGTFTAPATGLKTFSVNYEGLGRALGVSVTSGSQTFTESRMLLCSKVGVAEVDSPPAPNVIYNYAMYGEKSLFFGAVPSGTQKSLTFTLSNDGGSDLLITDISFSGGGSDQFMPATVNAPTATAPITVPAYGGMKDLTIIFAPTRNNIYNLNVVINGKYVDPDGGEHVIQPFQIPVFAYSKQMIWNPSFETPHNIFGEGNNLVYAYPQIGWTFTSLRASHPPENHFGVAPMGTWATYQNGGSAPAIQDSGLKMDGNQIGFIRRAGTITQTIPGFNAGRNYRFVFWVLFCRGNNDATGVPWSATAIHPTDSTKNATLVAANSLPWPTDWRHMTLNRFDATFTPKVASAYTLEIKNNEDTGSDTDRILGIDLVKLYQEGGPAVAYCPTTSLDFGTAQKGDLGTSIPLTIYNDGGSTLTVNGITITGPNADQFDLLDNQGKTINPAFKVLPFYNTTTTLVRFKGTSEGQKYATLTISTGNQYVSTGNIVVNLTGNIPLAPALANGSFELKTPDLRDNSRFKMYAPLPLSPDSQNQGFVNNDTTYNNPLGWKGYIGWDGATGHTDCFMPALRNGSYDNGVGNGTYAYEIRKAAADPLKSVYQMVPGFRAGRSYHISAKFNVKTATVADAFIAIDGARSGATYATARINPSDAVAQTYSTAFTPVGFDYTPATDSAHKVEVGLLVSGTADDILIDDVRVEEINAKVAVDQTSLRFPDLVVQKQDGSTYSWFYPPTLTYLKITNVGYNTALHFTGTGTGHPGLTLSGDSAFEIVSVTPDTTSDLPVGSSIEVVLRYNPAHDAAYSTLGSATGNLAITTNDPNYPTVNIPLNASKVPVEMGSFNIE